MSDDNIHEIYAQENNNEVYLPSGFSHAFDVKIATMLGIECAILLNHFQFWINHNREMGKNLIDGKTWMYQSRKEMAAHFPYWNEDEVRRLTDKLVNSGILIKGNFNKSAFDKTLWYAFKNEKMFTIGNFAKSYGKIAKSSGKIATPIPYIETDTEKKESLPTLSNGDILSKEKTAIDERVLFFISEIQKRDPSFKLTANKEKEWLKDIEAMQKEDGRSWDDIKELIVFSQSDPFWSSRASTTKNLRKNSTTIYLQMKRAIKLSKEELEDNKRQEEIKRMEEIIKKNRKYIADWINNHPEKSIQIGIDGISYKKGKSNFYILFHDLDFEKKLLSIG